MPQCIEWMLPIEICLWKLQSCIVSCFWHHNHLGFPDAFRLELGNLYRGVFRQLTQQNPAPPASD